MSRSVALTRSVQDEGRIANAFRDRRAVDGASAQPLVALGLHDSRVLRGMVTDAVVRRAGPHRFFLDEGAWAGRRSLEWRNVLRTVVAVSLAVMGIALFLYSR